VSDEYREEADEAIVFCLKNLWELHSPPWERRIRALMNRVRELEAESVRGGRG